MTVAKSISNSVHVIYPQTCAPRETSFRVSCVSTCVKLAPKTTRRVLTWYQTQPAILGNQSLTSRQKTETEERKGKKPLISSRNLGRERRCIPILEATRREDLNGPRKKCAILSGEENSYCLTLP